MNEIFIILGLILLNGIFAMAEVALISARKSNLEAESKRAMLQHRQRYAWPKSRNAFSPPCR